MTKSGYTRAALAAAALLLPVAALAGPSPSRPTNSCSHNRCRKFDHVVLDSYVSKNPNVGDERRFYQVKDAQALNNGYRDSLQVRDGEELELAVWVDNDANAAHQAARNVVVQAQLPGGRRSGDTLTAAISADNARPQEVDDTVDLRGGRPFSLTYVSDSTRWQSSDGTSRKLPDTIPGNGVRLGDIQPGFSHEGYVLFRVRVSMPRADRSAGGAATGKGSSGDQSGQNGSQNHHQNSKHQTGTATGQPFNQHMTTGGSGGSSGAATAAGGQGNVANQSQSQSNSQPQSQSQPTPRPAQQPSANQPAPAQPPAGNASLPATGATAAAGGVGSGAIGYALVAYRRSRGGLRAALDRTGGNAR